VYRVILLSIVLSACGGNSEEPDLSEHDQKLADMYTCLDQDGVWHLEGCSDFPFCRNLSHDMESYCECLCLTRRPDDQDICNVDCNDNGGELF